jgi:HK97 family phage portal protein
VYLSDHGYVTLVNVPRENVLHFPNTFRRLDGLWGLPTLQYAIETLSLNRTLKAQGLETAAKGGRVKLIIGEEKPSTAQGTFAAGLLDKEEMDRYALELQTKMYNGHDVLAIRGLDKVQNISMSASEMQMFEQLGATNDDVARFFGVPRPLLMLDTNSHYNDYQNATMEFHTRTILPQKTGNEKEIFRKLIGIDGYGTRDIHICEDPLMVMDPERRAKVAQLKMQAGLCTVNEARRDFDMPAVEDGDVPMASANLMTLKALIAKSDASTTLKPGNYTVGEEPPADEK